MFSLGSPVIPCIELFNYELVRIRKPELKASFIKHDQVWLECENHYYYPWLNEVDWEKDAWEIQRCVNWEWADWGDEAARKQYEIWTFSTSNYSLFVFLFVYSIVSNYSTIFSEPWEQEGLTRFWRCCWELGTKYCGLPILLYSLYQRRFALWIWMERLTFALSIYLIISIFPCKRLGWI